MHTQQHTQPAALALHTCAPPAQDVVVLVEGEGGGPEVAVVALIYVKVDCTWQGPPSQIYYDACVRPACLTMTWPAAAPRGHPPSQRPACRLKAALCSLDPQGSLCCL